MCVDVVSLGGFSRVCRGFAMQMRYFERPPLQDVCTQFLMDVTILGPNTVESKQLDPAQFRTGEASTFWRARATTLKMSWPSQG